MTRVVLLVLATVLLLMDGVVYGRWTDRWGSAPLVQDAVARLDRVPLRIGSWHGATVPQAEEQATRAGCAGSWVRRYERSDGAVVFVMLACGRPGPLAVHTPDVCYTGSGYTQSEPAVQFTADRNGDGAPATFWKTRFSKPDALVPVNLRLFWSWHSDDSWRAPRNPRLEFAGAPVLHKLYVIREMDGQDDQRDDSIASEFLTAFMPAFDAAMALEPSADLLPP